MKGWLLSVIFLHIGDNGETLYSHADGPPKVFMVEEACHIAGNSLVTREIELFDFDKYPSYIVKYECNEIHATVEGGKVTWPIPKRTSF